MPEENSRLSEAVRIVTGEKIGTWAMVRVMGIERKGRILGKESSVIRGSVAP